MVREREELVKGGNTGSRIMSTQQVPAVLSGHWGPLCGPHHLSLLSKNNLKVRRVYTQKHHILGAVPQLMKTR